MCLFFPNSCPVFLTVENIHPELFQTKRQSQNALPELQLPDMPLLSLVRIFILFFVLELTSRKDARTSEQP